MIPDIILYLESLKYPSSGAELPNRVCYPTDYQVRIPFIWPGQVLSFITRPSAGNYAWITWAGVPATDVVPNTLRLQSFHYGIVPTDMVVTQVVRDFRREGLTIITEQMPFTYILTNISPLAQRAELIAEVLVIPSINDFLIIMDALRRLHTSKSVEALLEQANAQLNIISGKGPKPSLGGG